jgi:uncharacterized membrane protein YfcA
MNGIKVVFGMLINAVAVLVFALSGVVDWPVALVMAVGSGIGGWAGAGAARNLGRERLRSLIIGVGLVVSAALFWKAFS